MKRGYFRSLNLPNTPILENLLLPSMGRRSGEEMAAEDLEAAKPVQPGRRERSSS